MSDVSPTAQATPGEVAPPGSLASLIQDPPAEAPAPAAPPAPSTPPAENAAGPGPSVPTQVKKPWRATVRTIFAMVAGIAALAPFAYSAATKQDPAAASGDAAFALAVAAGLTRVLALPAVENFLQKWFPWLSADTPAWH